MNADCHLYTLPQIESDENGDSSSDESDLEVISNYDGTTNDLSLNLDDFNLDDEDDDNRGKER
jgi:hypothetical protein